VAVTGLSQVRAIAARGNRSLALTSDGGVWAWGNNASGQLGDGSIGPDAVPVPTLISGLPSMSAIAAGSNYSLALAADGTVWAWGRNSDGELGIGSATPTSVPIPTLITGLPSMSAIAAGLTHSLALAADETVWAWGSNGDGQLGINSTDAQLLPVQIDGLDRATALAAGANFSLAARP
jgi:alpha-tubulin suppressor-like RCC1 family protein